MDNTTKAIAYYAGVIIKNQGFMIQLLANLQQDRKNADSSFEYGKNMVDFGTKVVKSTKVSSLSSLSAESVMSALVPSG